MPFVLDHSMRVEAPVDVVWEVITDLPRYGEWNPFQVAVRSTLEPGTPIDMTVQIFDLFTQPQRETIFECIPGERLAYGLAGDALGGLRSRREQVLHAEGETATRYESHFVLDGWLAPVTRALLGERLTRGFDAAAQALKDRAEMLAGGG